MKLSDYVMQFLEEKNAGTVFMLPGGGCMHLVDSLGRSRNLSYVTCLHEQAASIAAESYAQNTNGLGSVLVTTGPGGTNAITGLAAAWIDSTPVMFISGQVKRSDRIGASGVRQLGSQEVDIVPVVKSMTKYATTVMDPEKIRQVMEEAYYHAMSGRRGPVWIDIPLDVQAAEIEETKLEGFRPEKVEQSLAMSIFPKIKSFLEQARRPVILAGNGVKSAGMEDTLFDCIHRLNIPVLLTWKALDMLDAEDDLNFGCPGVMGHRYANFILQNADCLLILGSRLDSSLTAWNHKNFAPRARKIMVDIDAAEMAKMDMDLTISCETDLKCFLPALSKQEISLQGDSRTSWLDYCRNMRDRYPAVTEEMRREEDYVNAHAFVEELSRQLTSTDVIVPESSGGAGEITYQAFRVKKGQKIKNAAGLGSMGFGLPYAIGACIANGRHRTILINGDGAFQLNIQELATVVGQKLPIKIFIWENGGYASIQATQRNYFEGNYVGSNRQSKLFIPDLLKVADAYGLEIFQINHNDEMREGISKMLTSDGPALCVVHISPAEVAMPRVQSMKLPNGSMASKPLEDMWPYLPKEEVKRNMLT